MIYFLSMHYIISISKSILYIFEYIFSFFSIFS